MENRRVKIQNYMLVSAEKRAKTTKLPAAERRAILLERPEKKILPPKTSKP